MTDSAAKIVASLRRVGGCYDYVAAIVEDRAPKDVLPPSDPLEGNPYDMVEGEDY